MRSIIHICYSNRFNKEDFLYIQRINFLRLIISVFNIFPSIIIISSDENKKISSSHNTNNRISSGQAIIL
jgi:hypothetical protein